MRVLALLIMGLMLATMTAGCMGATTSVHTTVVTKGSPLATGKGAVVGLVIDDVYRPIPKANVYLFPLGHKVTSDGAGVFGFGDLEPGSYTVKVESAGHEAAPVNVDVALGEYTELELSARRLVSDAARIVTMQYSVFIPCAVSASLISQVNGYCFFDASGDSYRPGLDNLNFTGYNTGNYNATYLVTEMSVNQPDHYVLVARHDNGESFGGEEWGRSLTQGGDYAKITLKRGENYMQTDNSVIWNNTLPMQVILFYYGPGGDQITDAVAPTWCDQGLPNVPNPLASSGKPLVGCREYYGVGAKMGVEAKILLSLFLGAPDQPIEDYGLLHRA